MYNIAKQNTNKSEDKYQTYTAFPIWQCLWMV